VLRIPVWELAIRDGVGARIGSIVSVFDGKRVVGRSTPASTIAVDGYASFRLPIRRVKAGERYYVYLRGINDIHGNRIGRRAIVIGTIGPVESG